MSTNIDRAQMLADAAFDILMHNPSGDGKIFEERPLTERQEARVKRLSRLSTAYGMLAGAKGDGFWREGEGE